MYLVCVILDSITVPNQHKFSGIFRNIFAILCPKIVSFSVAISTDTTHIFSQRFWNSNRNRTRAVPCHDSFSKFSFSYDFDFASTSYNVELSNFFVGQIRSQSIYLYTSILRLVLHLTVLKCSMTLLSLTKTLSKTTYKYLMSFVQAYVG